MNKLQSRQVSFFNLEGRFLGFEFADGYKLKYIKLATSEGECYVKLAKHLRLGMQLNLIPGDWITAVGEKKLDLKTGKLKLKAERIIPSAASHEQISAPTIKSTKTSASILVCQKSDCMKRGGKGVCQALEAALSERGLEGQVTIKGTGCLKQCKAGPNLVVMPDKTRYSRIQAGQVPELLDKHFAEIAASTR